MDSSNLPACEPSIDKDLGIKLAGNNPELANEMFQLFITSLPQELADISQSKESSDWLNLTKRVHKLHGAACYCGVPRLKKILHDFEHSLKANETEKVHPYFTALEAEITQLMTQASNFSFNK